MTKLFNVLRRAYTVEKALEILVGIGIYLLASLAISCLLGKVLFGGHIENKQGEKFES